MRGQHLYLAVTVRSSSHPKTNKYWGFVWLLLALITNYNWLYSWKWVKNLLRPFWSHLSYPQSRILSPFGKPSKNHCQWFSCDKTFNGDGWEVTKPLENHRWQWCPEKLILPSHRWKKLTIVQVYYDQSKKEHRPTMKEESTHPWFCGRGGRCGFCVGDTLPAKTPLPWIYIKCSDQSFQI